MSFRIIIKKIIQRENVMKEYLTYVIEKREEIERCPEFQVNHVQWKSKCAPKTTGKMAYLKGEGIIVRMKCEEKNPLRVYTKHMDMVCEDSAMEAFFSFPDDEKKQPDIDSLYFNFEINANGALYANTGYGRKDRQELLPEEMILVAPKAVIERDEWHIEMTVPETLIQRFLKKKELSIGDIFYCNFYKISETPEIEHYISYNYIESDTPNFHLPPYFGKAVLADG